MTNFLTAFFLLTGAALMFLAALGLLRMPDLLTRMHATSKAGALGSGLMVFAVAAAYSEPGITARAVAVMVFIIMTAPVAAHAIARAGYVVGIDKWEGTIKDDFEDEFKEHNSE